MKILPQTGERGVHQLAIVVTYDEARALKIFLRDALKEIDVVDSDVPEELLDALREALE